MQAMTMTSKVLTKAPIATHEKFRGLEATESPFDEPAECMACWPLDEIDLEDGFKNRKNSETISCLNEPHPALEYPMCYHVLKRFPRLLEGLRVPYDYRWKLAYPLQRKVPFSRCILKLGVHLTWGELLLLLPFFLALCCGIIYSSISPSVSVTGKVARFVLIAAFVLAQRNSLVTLLVGMPVDRALFYHKLAGRLGGLTGLLHTLAFFIDPKFTAIHKIDFFGGAFTGQVNTSGTIMMLLITGIVITSLPMVRKATFETFYYLHFVFVGGLVVGTFFHTGILVPTLAFLTWGVDFGIRKVLMAWTINPRKATLKLISDTVVQVSFRKTEAFSYNPGQYIYLSIPEITWLEWHPFSISSCPNQPIVTLHIRKAGNWTTALFQLANKKKVVDILLEGPYGSMAVDIMGDRKYKSVLLISGGIGVTPMQSICDQLLYEKSAGQRELRNLKFIWIERDPVLVQHVEFVKSKEAQFGVGKDKQVEEKETPPFSDEPIDGSVGIATQLMTLFPPGKTTDAELEVMYANGGLPADDETFQIKDNDNQTPSCEECPPLDLTGNNKTIDTCDDSVVNAKIIDDVKPKKVTKQTLDMQIYLTGDSKTSETVPFARFGRPDIKALFDEMRNDAIASGDKKVAVCVSAPHKLMSLCHKACVLYSDETVRFDFHSEAMAV